METTLIIEDQVNVRFTDLDATTRRKISEKLKFMVPYARHVQSFKMGRWDGKVAFATVGGATYLNVLDRVLPLVQEAGYQINVEDRRPQVSFNIPLIDENYLATTRWPAGHPKEGEPIMLREHQVKSINEYLRNLQSLQSISTSAGKAQPLTSKILTPTGWVAMGDIEVGQKIITQDGSETSVLGVYPQGEKRIFRLTFADGRSAEACVEHLWKAFWRDLDEEEFSNGIVSTNTLIDMLRDDKDIAIPLFAPPEGKDQFRMDANIRWLGGDETVERARSLGYIAEKISDDEVQIPVHDGKLRLISIEEIGNAPAQCIMVEHPSHLYVTDNYIVTHNTIITGCLSKLVEPYGRSLVIVPGKDLVIQTCKDYTNIGLDTGRYFGDFKEPDHKHTIATWQSLTALAKNNPTMLHRILKDCVAVIVDEAHSIKGKELKDLLTRELAHVPIRWALTGTVPKDDFEYLALQCSIGPNVGSVRAKDLMELGILSNCHINIMQTVDDVEYKSWDTERDYLATDRERVAWITEFARKTALTGNTLLLVSSIEQGKMISEALGVPFIYGGVKSKDRANEYDSINYTDNQLIVATFGVASTGINIPRIFNLIIVEAGKSFTRVIQSIGRGLRTAKDKDWVDIYDICSTAKFSKRHLKARKEFYDEAEYPTSVTKIVYR